MTDPWIDHVRRELTKYPGKTLRYVVVVAYETYKKRKKRQMKCDAFN